MFVKVARFYEFFIKQKEQLTRHTYLLIVLFIIRF